MSFLFMLAVQASGPISGTVPSSFDLEALAETDRLRLGIHRDCAPDSPNEIVVCGRRDPDRYRHKVLPPRYEVDGIPKAELGLGDGMTGGVELEQVGNPDGTASKRIMVRLKKPF